MSRTKTRKAGTHETSEIYIALVHYPVYNKRQEIIAAALTTIDIHDLARLAATYGVKGFFLVTPLEDQLELARDMIDHWLTGWGAGYNQDRAASLKLVSLAENIGQVEDRIRETSGSRPLTVATAAGDGPGRSSFSEIGSRLDGGRPILLMFGTAWGLASEVLAESDYILEPVKGSAKYNHLSVRSAAGIILDRLLGGR